MKDGRSVPGRGASSRSWPAMASASVLASALAPFLMAALSAMAAPVNPFAARSPAAASGTAAANAPGPSATAAVSAAAASKAHSVAPGFGTAAPGESWVRVGVIIASRKGLPDDKPLRFAYQDGEKLERLLVTVGQIEPENLFFVRAESRLPLEEAAAKAGARIAALKKAGHKVFLQFYYTGHGAARNFHLSDGPMDFDRVKGALGGIQADARVYVLDVCYGASFFTAKGFRTAPPLQLQMEMDKGARGEVTISSSAGDEQAYEVRTLGGSIFTSHWIMALRGAGDRNRDGQVTLFEAYNYAYDRTAGYSAETLARPQHPSFQIDLTGARDMTLARLLRSSTGILFRNCPAGNYNLLDMGRGHQIGELRVPGGSADVPAGSGEEFTLALEQGRYRVQYLPARGATLSADVDLSAAGMTPLPFTSFSPVVADAGQMKGPAASNAGGWNAGASDAGPADASVSPEARGDGDGESREEAMDGPAAFRRPGQGPGSSFPAPVSGSRQLPGDSRWRITSSMGMGFFQDGELEDNIQQSPEVDDYFGLGGRFEAPISRRNWGVDLGFSPWGPWMLGLRMGVSSARYSRKVTGREPLDTQMKSDPDPYPVRLDWNYDFLDVSMGGYLGHSFRVTGIQTLSADIAWSLVTRTGDGVRILERPLYQSTTRTRHETDCSGYRLEAGLGWWVFPRNPEGYSIANVGLGMRVTPYFQRLRDLDPQPGGHVLDSREAGIALSFILSLGRSRPASGSEQ